MKRRFIVCVLFPLLWASSLFAQDVGTGSGQNEELSSLLKKLKKSTQQLRSELQGTNQVVPQPRPSIGSQTPSTKPDEGVQEAYKAIQERIRLLKDIRQERASSPSMEQLPNAGKTTPIKPPTPTLPEAAMLQINNPPPTAVKPKNDQPPPMEATRIMPNPVDTFEMGNSIFLTGNFTAALEAYSKVDEKKLTAEDAMWLHTMKAACKRKLKQESAATGFYREITNSKVGSEPVKKNAEFWLKYIEAKGRNQQLYESIDQDLTLLLERTNERITKTR